MTDSDKKVNEIIEEKCTIKNEKDNKINEVQEIVNKLEIDLVLINEK